MSEFDFSKICAALMLIGAICVILKNFGYKGAPVFAALSVLVFFSLAVKRADPIWDVYSEFVSYSGVDEYAKIAVKIIGIGYLSGIGSDVCRELGEAGIAKCIGVFAKFELILIIIPVIKEILKVSESLMGV